MSFVSRVKEPPARAPSDECATSVVQWANAVVGNSGTSSACSAAPTPSLTLPHALPASLHASSLYELSVKLVEIFVYLT